MQSTLNIFFLNCLNVKNKLMNLKSYACHIILFSSS